MSTLRLLSGAVASAVGSLLLTFSAGVSASRFSEIAQLPAIDVGTVTVDPAQASGRGVYLVQLAQAPAAVAFAEAMQGADLNDAAALGRARVATRSRVAAIRAAQDAMLPRISAVAPGANVLYRTSKSINGIVIELSGAEAVRVRGLAGVRSVQFMEPEFPTLSTSVPFIGSDAVWDGAGFSATGEGVSIAIIDTGVDYQHPAFGGSGVLADYQANDRTVISEVGAAAFPTARVVGGFDFAGDAYTGSNVAVPDPDPMDCLGHGMHVASTAAGGGVNLDGTAYTGPFDATTDFNGLRIGPGVAPKADVYALRVFGCGGSTNLTVNAIDWAMDPNGDDDLSDHVDIINMSLGSNFGTLSTATAVASDNAALAGIVVVASAGNAGDTFTISGSPGSGTRVITVANIADDGVAGAAIQVNTPPAIAGPKIAANSAFTAPGPAPAPSGQTADVIEGLGGINGAFPAAVPIEGCGAFTNAAAVAGKIAMVRRGQCGFALKAENAQAAGAIGVIIYNNAVGDPAPPGMGGAPTVPVTIPAVSTTLAVASDIIAAITNFGSVNATLNVVDAGDVIATSSSRGPRMDDLTPKPDVAAPGTAITAAQTGVVCTSPAQGCLVANASGFIPGGQTLTIGGTSMAAPHVAGVAALLRQLQPQRSVEEIKAAIMNGALHDVTLGAQGTGGRLATSRVGSGRVDALESAALEVTAFNADSSGGVSIGFDGEITGSTTQTRQLRLVNHADTASNLTFAFDTILDSPGVDFALPGGTSLSLAAGQSATVLVQMTADAALMAHPRDPTMSPTVVPAGSFSGLGAQGRHWLSEESAVLVVSDAGNPVARVPVYSAPRAMATITAPATIDTAGAATGTAPIALGGTGVCSAPLAGTVCNSVDEDVASIYSAYELQRLSPRNTDLPEFNDIRYVGVATDSVVAGVARHYFGIGLYGRTQAAYAGTYQIEVDTNLDNVADRIIFNGDAGTATARLFGTTNVFGQDVNLNMVFNVATSGVAVSGLFELFNPLQVDLRINGTDVGFLSATPAQLGLANATVPFRYRVSTCFAGFPLCNLVLPAARMDQTDWIDWSPALRGASVSPFLNDAQPTQAMNVTWDTARLAATGSLGVLLLQHHNAGGMTQQAITFANTDNGVADDASDVSVALSVDATSPNVGDTVTFTVTAEHAGPTSPTDLATTILQPDGLTFLAATGDGTYDALTGVWTVTAAASGTPAELELTASVDRSGPITLAVDAMGTQADPDLSDNHAEVALAAANSSDIGVTIAPSANSIAAGDDVTLLVTVSNDGPDSAYSVNVANVFGGVDAAALQASEASAGVFDAVTGVWNIASLANGASETLELTYTLTEAGSFDFESAATIADNDPNVPNDDAATIVVTAGPLDELVVVSGDAQDAFITTSFAAPLVVRAEDEFDNALAGINVTFIAPGAGASATFVGSATVVTDAGGLATSPELKANATAGVYQVAAGSGALTVEFDLTNTAAGTSTVLAADDLTPALGESVEFTATVTADAGINTDPVGTVDFAAGAEVLCDDVALVAGVATCSTSFAASGAVTVTASYSGTGSFVASQDTLDLTVGPPLGNAIFADGFED